MRHLLHDRKLRDVAARDLAHGMVLVTGHRVSEVLPSSHGLLVITEAGEEHRCRPSERVLVLS